MFGITRQAYYQHWEAQQVQSLECQLIIAQVKQIRYSHRAMGTRKLYEKLQPFLLEHHIKIGRDALFDVLAVNGLLVRKRKRRISTTNSYHQYHKYPNLIKDFIAQKANALYVSDITYWKVGDIFLYLSLVTDAYSHKIVGFYLSDSLETVGCKRALQMALKALNRSKAPELIHHSDRGVQYCSSEYVKLLQDYDIKISMTENGDPRENAIAERVNGILKEEYLKFVTVNDLQQAQKAIEKVIALYNQERPHNSIGNLTPEKVHHNPQIEIEKIWKSYYKDKQTKQQPLPT